MDALTPFQMAVNTAVAEIGEPKGTRQTVCGPLPSHAGIVLVITDKPIDGEPEMAETCTAAFTPADCPEGRCDRAFIELVKRRVAAAMTRWRVVGLVCDAGLDEAIKLSLAD